MNNIAIIGAGSFGTAISEQLLSNGNNKVTLFVRGKKQCKQINKKNLNKRYFENFKLNSRIKSSYHFQELKDYEIIILAIPSSRFEFYEDIFINNISKNALIINMSKGLLKDGITIHDYFSLNLNFKNFVSLKGPSFSSEVIGNHPTLLTLGYSNHDQVNKIREIFENTIFYFDFTT